MAIVGYMGSGKSTVGRLLAQALDWEFISLDDEISAHEECIIPEIFENRGEDFFRELEHETLLGAMAGERGRVVACGGGVVVHPASRKYLKGASTVFLEEDLHVLYARTRGPGRPLRGADLDEFERRYLDRLAYYREVAGLTVRARKRPPGEIAEEIRQWLSA